MITRVALVFFLATTVSAFAQEPASPVDPHESRLHRDFATEGESLKACLHFSFGNLSSCGQTLILGQPMHLAFGSLAPQNGVGAGIAFVEHKDFSNEWRASWNVDAQATGNGSWQAGAYMKAYRLGGGKIKVEFPTPGSKPKPNPKPLFNSAPLLNLYSQTTSLTRVDFYGLGPNTTPLTHTTYGFTENVTGISGVFPLNKPFHNGGVAIVAEFNGRVPSVRPGTDAKLPSAGLVFNELSAPGLTRQVAYIEPSEGLLIYPELFGDHIRLNYLLQFQQFIRLNGNGYSFRRWNGDFKHEIPLYKLLPKSLATAYSGIRSPAANLQFDGPDDCTGTGANISMVHQAKAKKDAARPCPIISTTQKLEGSITLRAFLSESFANRSSVVPFYLSPTLGGSDINGASMLASYPDYRFRGPDLLLFRATLEHSLGKLPIGGLFSVDEGKIGLRRDDVSLDHLRHTFSIGITVHAGGLPVANLAFSWGGKEGTHTSGTVSPSLLGGSARPSLF